MNNHFSRKSRSIILITMVFCLVLLPISAARAQSPVPTGQIPAGQTVENSLLLYNPEVRIDGNVDGDVLAIGQTVVINGEVSGSLVIVGATVIINGKVNGDTYSAAGTLEMGPTGSVQRSIFFIGGFIHLKSGSTIGRDLNAMALGAELMASIKRSTRAYIGLAEVLQVLLVDTGLIKPIRDFLQSIPWPKFAPSSLKSQADLALQKLQMTSMGALTSIGTYAAANFLPSAPAWQQPTNPNPGIDWTQIGQWSLVRLRELIPLLLFGLLAVRFSSLFVNGATARLRKSPWLDLGYGLVGYVVGIVAIILTLTLVTALGFFFAAITLWDMAWLTWGLGLSSLGLAFGIFIFLISYFSKIIVSFLVGELILQRLSPQLKGRPYWSMALGIIIYILLRAVPILGWIISVLVVLFGLGAILVFYRDFRSKPAALQPVTAAPEPPIEL